MEKNFDNKQFGISSTDLCKAITEFTKKLCIADYLSPSLEPFLACHLNHLDKNHGLRPTGIGERNITPESSRSNRVSDPEISDFISMFIAGLCRA